MIKRIRLTKTHKISEFYAAELNYKLNKKLIYLMSASLYYIISQYKL